MCSSQILMDGSTDNGNGWDYVNAKLDTGKYLEC